MGTTLWWKLWKLEIPLVYIFIYQDKVVLSMTNLNFPFVCRMRYFFSTHFALAKKRAASSSQNAENRLHRFIDDGLNLKMVLPNVEKFFDSDVVVNICFCNFAMDLAHQRVQLFTIRLLFGGWKAEDLFSLFFCRYTRRAESVSKGITNVFQRVAQSRMKVMAEIYC